MALIKKNLGTQKYNWCVFIKKNFYMTDKLSETIYDLFIKNKIALGYLSVEPSDDHKANSLWVSEVKNNIIKILNLRGFGTQTYFRLVYGFKLPIISNLTFYVLSKDFISNDTEGSTILEFSKFVKHIRTALDSFVQVYNIQEQFDLSEKNILKYCSDELILFLDEKFNIISEPMQNIDIVKFMTTKETYDIEKFLYNYLKEISKKQIPLPQDVIDEIISKAPYKPNEKQLEFLTTFNKSGFNILNGYGGCGKSFSVKLLLDMLDKIDYKYILLTPTGIASKVLSNFTKRPSSTIHRWYYSNIDTNLSFKDIDLIILDESSMLGLDHWKMLVMALKNTKNKYNKYPNILMIGDTGQLQPISSGAFFRDFIDLIKTKVIKGNITSLEKVMRAKEDSFISYLSSYFASNTKEEISKSMYQNEEKGVYMIPIDDSLEEVENIVNFIYEYVEGLDLDWEDTTIIVPQRVGNKGTNKINELLLTKLKKIKGDIKPIGMITSNNYSLGVFNGEKFRIEDQRILQTIPIKDKATGEVNYKHIYEYDITMLDNGKKFTIEDGDINWELAYASTVHKLQGCTVKNVIFLCSRTHTFMLSKQLVYTGLSRASDTITCIYDKYTFEKARFRDIKYKRITFLGETVKRLFKNI